MKKVILAIALVSTTQLASARIPATTTVAPTVRGGWVRLLPGDTPSAGYFRILNGNDRPLALSGVRTDAFGSSMLHETRRDRNGVAGMYMVPQVTIPAHGERVFAPGSFHVMLVQPRRSLHVGDRLSLSLRFAPDQVVTTECALMAPGWIPSN